jgi:hypothetical protein
MTMVCKDCGQEPLAITACKQYCLAEGATQGNIAYTQTVMGKFEKKLKKLS